MRTARWNTSGEQGAEPRLEVVPNVPDAPVALADDFTVFYDANIGPLVGALTATLGNPVVAQDAAQEAMLRACQQWKKVGGYSNPMGWCYRVGLNWATSRWRKRRREVMSDRTVDKLLGDRVFADDPNPPDPAVLAALLRLSVDYRAVVVLRLWLDWSITDTATALDIAEGTVRSRLSRALDQLRVALKEDSPTAPQETRDIS